MAGEPSLEELLARMVPQTLHAESRGRDFRSDGRPVTSPKGARFAMQVMPGTGGDPGFGVRPASNPNDPAEVNRVGRDYLGAMLKRYGMDPAKAWGAYNAGPGRLDKALASGGNWLSKMPSETRAYVTNNLASLNGRPPQPVPTPQPTNPLPSPAMTDSPLASLSAPADPVSGAPPAKSPLDILSSLMGQRDQLDTDRAAMRQQQLEMARASLLEQRKGLSSADLFRLSAALAAPQRSKGFGGMMANVMPVLADVTQSHEQAAKTRKSALAQLQQQYLSGSLDDRGGSIDKRLELAKAMASAQPDKARQTWSENLGRFVSADARQPIGRVVNNGLQGVKYSDGTEEYADTDGTVAVYDAAGRKIATRRGNSTNAAP